MGVNGFIDVCLCVRTYGYEFVSSCVWLCALYPFALSFLPEITVVVLDVRASFLPEIYLDLSIYRSPTTAKFYSTPNARRAAPPPRPSGDLLPGAEVVQAAAGK